MKKKAYIAVLCCLLFTSKLFLVEANVFQLLLDSDEITFVNPFCKKKNAKQKPQSQENFSTETLTASFVLNLNCQNTFQISDFQYKSVNLEKEISFFSYLHSSLLSPYYEQQLPPPKQA
ncbi:hypothetical protein [Mesonia maritima]|uniref:Transmembrane protein n=1 Tax=Mesonia maritima TaxID=1793873 RepID=A0ABU1K6K2_9FLAO|nr:hypothetical protein [Mesonia maritima]MDR6300895.1 hypothetical protein [Mesonia maritima]